MADKNFEQAKNLLLGAVDAVIAIAASSQSHSNTAPGVRSTLSATGRPTTPLSGGSSVTSLPSTSTGRPISSGSSSLEEHRRLFGYQPNKGSVTKSRSRGGSSREGKAHANKVLSNGRRKASEIQVDYILRLHQSSQ